MGIPTMVRRRTRDELFVTGVILDIAVGAYLSSRVVLVKARAIMRYDARLAASSKQFSPMENEDVVVEFCIKVLTDVQDLVPVETDLNLDVDDRVTSDFYQRTISVTKTPSCFNITLKLTVTRPSIQPIISKSRLPEHLFRFHKPHRHLNEPPATPEAINWILQQLPGGKPF